MEGQVKEYMCERDACVSEIVGPNSAEKPLGRWKDRIKEYMCERGACGFKQ